jgi:hypothetical protein
VRRAARCVCMGFGARGPKKPVTRGAASSRTSWSMQSQIQPARRGGRRASSRLNRGVGGEAGRTLSGGPDTIRPRSRSDSDPSDGGGAAQRDCGRSSFRELDGSLRPDFPGAMPGPRSGYVHRELPQGKAGGVTNGRRSTERPGPAAPREAARVIRDSGAVPKFRAVPACPAVERAPPQPVQPGVFTGRRPRRAACSVRWTCLCIFHSDEECAG